MIINLSYVMTLANSVIGVSVLAMPFCFKQCGIVLAILMLLLSSILSKFACHLLVKSAVMSRRRNFEFLAFHSFGHTGKFLAELFIIGFLTGTCIAFFVVVGDLGPEIVGKMIGQSSEDIRTSLLIIIGIFIILPLGLLRNVDSLSSICTATIGFYLCLVLKVMTESMTHIFATDWYDKVHYWRPSGILQCLPIFSMALFCQTQLFEIYETIPNVCLDKMNHVVDVALNICTLVYICVGFFGYVAFCTVPFTGNILMSFEPSLSSEAIKIGFVLSLAFSFPLVIFPCRASLNSLLFRRAHSYETASSYIPESRFRWLTILIVAVSLITGILIPNIEFVLGLVGSTIGVIICLMFPAAFFISISSKNTNERLVAQAMLFIGVWIMILGTYANLYAMEESANAKLTVTQTGDLLKQLNNIPIRQIDEGDVQVDPPIPKIDEIPIINNGAKFKTIEAEKIIENTNSKDDDARKEPPIPVERTVVTEKSILEPNKVEIRQNPWLSAATNEKVAETKQKNDEEIKEQTVVLKVEEKIKEIEMSEQKFAADHKIDNLMNSDAIKKEESELAADADLAAEAEHDKKHEELKKTLKKHEIEQRQMLQEQKEIINTLKQQKKELEKEKKEKEASKKAVKNVEHDDRDPDTNLNIKSKERDDDTLDKSVQAAKNELTNIDLVKEEKHNENPSLHEREKNETIRNSRGPILSALVKKPWNNSSNDNNHIPKNLIQESVNSSDLTNSNLKVNQEIESKVINEKDDGVNLSKNNPQRLKNNNLSVPIALVMRNKTQTEDSKSKSLHKIDDKVGFGRDILENSQRSKRDVDEILTNENQKLQGSLIIADETEVDLKITDESVKSFVNDISQTNLDKECSKSDLKSSNNVNNNNHEKNEKESNDEKVTTEELLLIKTNSYLSDQSFSNANSLDKNLYSKIAIGKLNQRALEPVSSKNGNSK